MLSIWLRACRRLSVHEVTVNLHSHAEAVRSFITETRPEVPVRIAEEPELLGSAGTLRRNRAWVEGEKRFWIFYGDVLTSADLEPMLALHDSIRPIATLGLCRSENPTSCGIAKLTEDGIISDFAEKPPHPKGNLAFAGVMVGTPAMLDDIPPVSPVDIGFHLLPRLVGRMAGYNIRGYLKDIGTLSAYAAAQREWPRAIESGAGASTLQESGSGEHNAGRPELNAQEFSC